MYLEYTEGKDSVMVDLSWQTWWYLEKKNDSGTSKSSVAVNFWKLLVTYTALSVQSN